MNQITEILKQARALIADKSKWTQDAAARDLNGRPCGVREAGARCFCAYGAVQRVTPVTSAANINPALDVLNSAACRLVDSYRIVLEDGFDEDVPFITVNDTLSHKDVLAMFDEAIAISEAGAK